MFSKALVEFTSLQNPLSLLDNLERQNINDDIHAREYTYQCQHPYTWIRRECVGAISPYGLPVADVCFVCFFSTYYATAYDNKSGSCPVGRLISGYRHFIDLHQMRLGRRNTENRKLDPQAGTSEEHTQKRVDLGNSQLQYSDTRPCHDWGSCGCCSRKSVFLCYCLPSCFFDHVANHITLSDDGSFLIAPNNFIVHGKTEQLCQGDNLIGGEPAFTGH